MYSEDVAEEAGIDVSVLFKRDNTVTPLSFWTPDDKEIKIDKVLESLNAATFKTAGTGDRYRIQAHTTVSYLFRIGDLWYMGHPSNDMRIPGIHTKYVGEYYGGKKVIDERYDNPHKVAVDVAAICYAIGDVVPFGFYWPDGTEYEIDRVIGWERAVSIKAGIVGVRYAIRVLGRETYLFRDDDLWYMERRDKRAGCVLDVHGRPVL